MSNAHDSMDLDLTGYLDKRGALVPPGEYDVVIHAAEKDISANNNVMFNLYLRILTPGEFQKMTISDRVTITDKSLWRAVSLLKAVGIATPTARFSVPLRTLEGKRLRVRVEDGDEYKGTRRSEVRDYLPVSAQMATSAAEQDLPVPAAPAPAAPAPAPAETVQETAPAPAPAPVQEELKSEPVAAAANGTAAPMNAVLEEFIANATPATPAGIDPSAVNVADL